MKHRCKLISPTNLMLERPMLSPAKETEFFVIGVLTYTKERMTVFQFGIVTGFALCALVFTVLEKFFGGK